MTSASTRSTWRRGRVEPKKKTKEKKTNRGKTKQTSSTTGLSFSVKVEIPATAANIFSFLGSLVVVWGVSLERKCFQKFDFFQFL